MEKLLTQLKLARIREVYQDWIDKASKEDGGTLVSYADFLRGLLSEETCAREENQIARRMRQAGFPILSFLAVGDPTFEKTIEQFDFSLRPELKRQVVLNCMDETFVHQGRSMVLIGPPGTGKTHVSISVGIKMIQLGYSVKFVMAQGLINDYVGMTDIEDRQELLNSLAKADLLIIDEFGYLPHDKEAGSLFYQVISDRYEKNGTIITSNKSLRSWAEMLHDSSLATALIDRLMHHGEVFYLSGNSYRLRGKKKYLEGNIPSSEPELEMSDRQVKTD
jgi:DNA replication protein DnaC